MRKLVVNGPAAVTNDRVHLYFALALIALAPLAIYAPWASLMVPGFAIATPIKQHARLFAALWILAGFITAVFLFVVIGLLFPRTSIHDGPVHPVQ